MVVPPTKEILYPEFGPGWYAGPSPDRPSARLMAMGERIAPGRVLSLAPAVSAIQAKGYAAVIAELDTILRLITGYDAISFQPNSGAQGEYAGLLAIRKYHESRGDAHRNICLIPSSAHGTNPATAQMASMRVVIVECDEHGNVDLTTAETAVDRAAVRYDRQGDQHYDVVSAFIKSVRGSDVDAALLAPDDTASVSATAPITSKLAMSFSSMLPAGYKVISAHRWWCHRCGRRGWCRGRLGPRCNLRLGRLGRRSRFRAGRRRPG